ncbi:MAG: hypothetical protein QNJ14_18830 [Woeseiaceae bacterium]|nr:hypothetical protein [Woeseiaceae bacterium]
MKIATFLYNGYYSFFARSRLSTKPDFSAWASCTLASIFYYFALFSILDGLVQRWTGHPIPWGFQIQTGLGIALVLGSDWNIRHTWFGAKREDLPEERLRKARLAALLVLIGSWIAFITTAILVYAPD